MHHKIDVHPIPDSPIYINDLSIATTYNPYELKRQAELAVTGKTVSKGGILPDDNVRVYVPLDINAEYIIGELYSVFGRLGAVSEDNEYEYSSEVRRIITKLEIYDQIHTVRDMKNAVNMAGNSEVGKYHSRKAIAAAKKMVEILEGNEGTAECFPYEIVEELKAEFGLISPATRFFCATTRSITTN